MSSTPESGWAALVAVAATLRSEGGCPWDRAQTPASMRPYLLEETHEVLETLDRDEPVALREELGDLLFNVVLIARMAEERGWFTVDQVAGDIAQKMIVRHPHVFEPGEHDVDAGTLAAWEARKAARAAPGRSRLDGLPPGLPALLHAHRAGEKAAQVGLDWPDAAGARAKLDEELAELDAARAGGDDTQVVHELGDVLMTLAQLARHLGVGGEDALRMANQRFGQRFRHVERAAAVAGRELAALDTEALDALWTRAKSEG